MSDDLIGKLVRWEHERGQWFTARVTGGDGGSGRGSLVGEVVDPGNYIGISEFAPKQALQVGAELPNLRPELLTVIDEEVIVAAHESAEIDRLTGFLARVGWELCTTCGGRGGTATRDDVQPCGDCGGFCLARIEEDADEDGPDFASVISSYAKECVAAARPLAVADHLQSLLDAAFPDEDSDYHYGCERLLDLVRDSIPALRGEGQTNG